MRIAFYTTTTLIAAMIGFTALNGEDLVTENGKVDALTLPLDKETSKVAYETATFGIG
jgi:hypothetical protein